jgi:catechol 2,3-dioxygenase-like lactoylglutathione lyase family enzyme
MKAVRINHVSVNCEGQLDATRRFYAEMFGLGDAKRPDIPGIGGHWFSVGDAQLHLVDARASGAAIDPVGDHWCIEVEDIDAARTELEASGITYVEGAQGPVVQIWVTDPAGRTLELQQVHVDPEREP